MRIDIFVPTVSTDEQLRFYVQQLGLFVVGQDYGMGNVLLRHVEEPSFCLLLQPGRVPSGQHLFCMSTTNCRAEFARLSGVSFDKGGLIPGPDGALRVFEYPLGETISLRDASGNSFVIAEWHPNAY